MGNALAGRTVALAEGRQLEDLARMLEAEGAAVVRCPLVGIRDAPDPAPVLAWLRELIAGRFGHVVLLTGEGLRRLLGFAERAGLRERGIEPRIMHKARRNRPLTAWQTWFNKAVAPIRAGVERVFGTMKRAYGYRRVRYLGLARNDAQLQVMCAAINLRRALVLGLA